MTMRISKTLLPFLVLYDTCSLIAASAVPAPAPRRSANPVSTVKLRRMFPGADQMPSLFGQEEEVYDRYAACLAATEGLRRIRDRDLAEATSEGNPRQQNQQQDLVKERRKIAHSYIQNSSRVLKAMGMSIQQFNELGREIAQSDQLKGKIMEQAYLYRMAATISFDRMHFIDDDEEDEHNINPAALANFRRDKVKLFCQSMNEIEKLRSGQVERLKRVLQVDSLPSNINICDRTLQPFLAPRVRAVVEAFPLQAEAIVKRHGLQSQEFNQMLKATKANPIFRWKIQKQLRIGDLPAAKGSTSKKNIK